MGSSPPRPWETLASRELFMASPWLRLSVDKVRLSDGRVVEDFYQIQLPEYVVIVAQTSDGRIILERQYKHGIGRVTLILPSGYIKAEEEPLAAAQRELLEETGYVADDWRSLGCFIVDGNRGCGKAHLFVACHARRVTAPDPGDLEDLEILLMKPEAIVEAIQAGEAPLLATVAAITLAIQAGLVSLNSTQIPKRDE